MDKKLKLSLTLNGDEAQVLKVILIDALEKISKDDREYFFTEVDFDGILNQLSTIENILLWRKKQ